MRNVRYVSAHRDNPVIKKSMVAALAARDCRLCSGEQTGHSRQPTVLVRGCRRAPASRRLIFSRSNL
jgi:hypothetical protein